MQTLKMAWRAILSNKLRTFLTMLGIIIGVTALIVLVSITNGATNDVMDSVNSMGTDYLSVQISDDKDVPIRYSELISMFDDESVGDVSPIAQSSATGETSYTEGSTNLYGVSGGYFRIMGMDEVAFGRILKSTDLDNNNYVIVLSYDTAVEFFGHANAVGESLSLDGRKFEVVGVLAEDASTPGSQMSIRQSSDSTNSDDSEDSSDSESVTLEGFIPYTTMSRISDNVLDISQFYVSASDEDSMDGAESYVNSVLLERFSNDEDAFTVTSQEEIMEARAEISNTFSLLLGGIAAISLLVGGIGIMNIMLVSVTERTREIGIRKAIGATQGSILMQFLLEALIVSLAGCAAGILTSEIIIHTAGNLFSSGTLTMDSGVAGIAVLFSALIGVVFGIYPAQKAARKKPIDALRYSE
ncbi:MAG: ABC transporter permease [Bilifractor sp.]|jgi:putative ABC transport system permease protein